jgi:uncharacterized SAM-binding protein YcdF (DUF218 family)
LTARQIWLVVVAVVGLGLLAALTAALIVWPYEQTPLHADAVVVLGAGSAPDRVRAALQLMNRGTADTLVVMSPSEDTRLCRRAEPYKVICIVPRPFKTWGEAEAIGRLAKRRSWTRLTVVTSTYHVTRARLLLARCFHGKLAVVGSRGSGIPTGPVRALHELGGLLYAIVRPRC